MTTLWQGTSLEEFAPQVLAHPVTRLTYYLAQVEQTISEVFGVAPDAEDIPEPARQVAHMMMQTLTGLLPQATAETEIARILAEWKKGAH